ncbi:MAG: hypothetical protein KDN18_01630 [Verrucomicrobiae bacterium]|nr:hypothetical protein [Verrucomicrobiae bacterium]
MSRSSRAGSKLVRRFVGSLLSLLALAVSTISTAQETQDFPALSDLKGKFEEALAKQEQPITDLNGSFSQALKRLMDSETAKGHLDGVLQVQKEIEAFGDGSTFAASSFLDRKTNHEALALLRTKYLSERERLWRTGAKDRDDLLKSFEKALLALEQEQTRQSHLDLALLARQAREGMAQDPRFNGNEPLLPGSDSFAAVIHFVGKGEVELRHKGERLSYRNTSSDRDKYIDGSSIEFQVQPGDVIHVRMRATAVFRSLIMTIESKAGDRAIPLALKDYRYLGVKADAARMDPKVEDLLKIDTRPDPGSPDGDMADMWNRKSISNLSRTTAEWIKCGNGSDWHDYAVIIQREMMLSVPSE